MSDAIKRLRGLADDIDWYVFNNGGIPRELRAIADEMETENAKLRELVRIAVKYCDSGTCDGCPIMGEDESCPYSDIARGLGVEVDG